MRHARPGRIIMQMAAIIGIGFALGVADATLRPIDLKARKAPPPISIPTPKSPATDPGTSPQPANTPPVSPTLPNTAAPAAAPAATPGEKPFVQTPKEALPAGQITIDEAKALYDQGLADNSTYFVDARKIEEFVKGHVINAIRIDTPMFQIKEPDELGLIPRQANVVVYCNGGHCDESENVAKRLDGSGYTKVYVMHDGFPGWKALGHPIATGE